MNTGTKIAIGVGVAAAVAGVVWYVRKKNGNQQPATNFSNQQPETALPNQQPATALPVQIPGSPILTTAPVYTPTYTPQAERVYAPVDYSRATMIKRDFVEENLAGLRGLSYLLR